MCKKVTTRRGRLKKHQRQRLARLRNKLYTPADIAREIGIQRRQIYRVYRHLGMPCKVNENGRILINGVQFRNWYRITYAKVEMMPNQTFCKTCFEPVEIVDPQIVEKNGIVFKKSKCPSCGRTLSRIIANHRKQYMLDQQGETKNDRWQK
jgi:ribosomal protein S27AE